jgi:hypothetical protein
VPTKAVGGRLSCDALGSGRHDGVGDAACGTKVSWYVLPPVNGAEPAAEALRFGLNDSLGAEYSSGLKSGKSRWCVEVPVKGALTASIWLFGLNECSRVAGRC